MWKENVVTWKFCYIKFMSIWQEFRCKQNFSILHIVSGKLFISKHIAKDTQYIWNIKRETDKVPEKLFTSTHNAKTTKYLQNIKREADKNIIMPTQYWCHIVLVAFPLKTVVNLQRCLHPGHVVKNFPAFLQVVSCNIKQHASH